MIIRNRNVMDSINFIEVVLSCRREFKDSVERLNRLDAYYRGEHDILQRKPKGEFAPKNKLVNNYAKYITDTSCGYLLGNPISYSADEMDISAITDILNNADVRSHDAELEKDLSVFGYGYELVYIGEETDATPKIALLDPRNTFVVFDNTVINKPLFGVLITDQITDTGEKYGSLLTVYTNDSIIEYAIDEEDESNMYVLSETEHYFDAVPIIMYQNNEEKQGDFEGVISLIDAYNLLQSDRVNDKESFVDAILLILNADLDAESAKSLAVNRMLIMPEDSDAKYITKALNENEIQILARSLNDDIHKFSQTPDFTDENFSGNTSGVAMAYKLLSLENLAKVKERFFITGLFKRLELIVNILGVKNTFIDLNNINIVLKRTLPVNEKELAETLLMLKDIVSHETLLSKLPFVDKIDEEIKRVQQERVDADARLNENFGINSNTDNERL